MTRIIILLLFAFCLFQLSTTSPPDPNTALPSLSEVDRVRLAEAFRLSDKLGDALWPKLASPVFCRKVRQPELLQRPLRSTRLRSRPADCLWYGKDLLARLFRTYEVSSF